MSKQQAQPGLVELMSYIDSKSLPKGICTRNFDMPVDHLLTKFLSDVKPFHPSESPWSAFLESAPSASRHFANTDEVITREFRPPKPDPAGILHIARSWGLTRLGGTVDGGESELKKVFMADGAEVKSQVVDSGGNGVSELDGEGEKVQADGSGIIMVGDSIDDMTAGRRAGAATVLLVNPANEHLASHEHTDLVISRLDDLIAHLEEGFTGRQI